MVKTVKLANTPLKNQSLLRVILGLLVLAIVCMTALELTNRTHLFHKDTSSGVIPSKVVTTENKSTEQSKDNSQQSSSNSSGQANNTTQASDKSSTTVANTGTNLSAPYGSFVSNHRPGQNGSNLVESSQCVTSPGAKCYIKFTKGDIVKTLEEKSTGSDGSVFWEWNITDAGLTRGSWTITAVATLGGQEKTTTDQIPLEVN